MSSDHACSIGGARFRQVARRGRRGPWRKGRLGREGRMPSLAWNKSRNTLVVLPILDSSRGLWSEGVSPSFAPKARAIVRRPCMARLAARARARCPRSREALALMRDRCRVPCGSATRRPRRAGNSRGHIAKSDRLLAPLGAFFAVLARLLGGRKVGPQCLPSEDQHIPRPRRTGLTVRSRGGGCRSKMWVAMRVLWVMVADRSFGPSHVHARRWH